MTVIKIKQPEPSVTFQGTKTFIATPAGDGKLDMRYFKSFVETIREFWERRVDFLWHCEAYNADIVNGRARIVREFLKTDCTHLLMIDSDMGWDMNAIARLFYANRDLVAVAGRKKIDPTKPAEFAANAVDDTGEKMWITLDRETQTIEVSEAGAAFILVTRACVEKMVAAYPNLRYEIDDDGPCYSLFFPIIRDNGKGSPRYYAEDFAFCRRWRDIGGKVLLAPDISLQHVGFHCWEGSLAQSVTKTPKGAQIPEQQAPSPPKAHSEEQAPFTPEADASAA